MFIYFITQWTSSLFLIFYISFVSTSIALIIKCIMSPSKEDCYKPISLDISAMPNQNQLLLGELLLRPCNQTNTLQILLYHPSYLLALTNDQVQKLFKFNSKPN